MDFPAEDLALATVPGVNFNPRVYSLLNVHSFIHPFIIKNIHLSSSFSFMTAGVKFILSLHLALATGLGVNINPMVYTSIHYIYIICIFIHSFYQALAAGLGVNINPMVYTYTSLHIYSFLQFIKL